MNSALALVRGQVESRLPGALKRAHWAESEFIASGVAAFDRIAGGVPRRALTQLVSLPGVSAGRTALLQALLARTTRHEEYCALVDAGDSFHAASGEAAGVCLSRLLWVRCATQGLKSLEQSFKAVDIVVQNGGFGLIAADLSMVPEKLIKKVPMTTWFRFARVIEKAPTALLFLLSFPAAQSCAGLTLHLSGQECGSQGAEKFPPAHVLAHLRCQVETGRTRLRQPVQSAASSLVVAPRWA